MGTGGNRFGPLSGHGLGDKADRWGRLVAQAGRPLPVIDSLLAATAAQHGLILVTRNLRDVQGLGAQVLDPWTG